MSPYVSFFSLFEIIQSLYWAIYGLVDLNHAELEEPHEFTEFIGKLMFGSYSWIGFVVLLNLLIAMMSNSYQNISVSMFLEIYAVFNLITTRMPIIVQSYNFAVFRLQSV